MTKKLVPFISEMLVLLFCILGTVTGLYAGDFFNISIRPHLLTFSACFIFSIAILYLVFPVLRRGIGALIDIIFQLRIETRGKIVNVIPMEGSIFTDKHKSGTEMRYCYIINADQSTDTKQIAVVSSEYFEYETNRIYGFAYSKYSKILLNVTQ